MAHGARQGGGVCAERALAVHEAVDVVGLIAFILKPAIIFVLDGLTCGDEIKLANAKPLVWSAFVSGPGLVA